jgi:hypothetical protein
MDPVVGAALGGLIQAVAALLRQMGVAEEDALEFFRASFRGVQSRPPGALPDARRE